MNAITTPGIPVVPTIIVLYNWDMSAFFQQVFSLLTSNPGSLAYHLVLAFTIIGVLQIAIGQFRGGDLVHGRRMVIGLSLLLALQFVLFAAAGLVWQGILDGNRALPILDRAVTLLSLLIIIWLWVFPDRVRSLDAATLLVGMLLLTVIFLGIVWFNNQPNSVVLSDTGLNQSADILAITLSVVGILLLVIRRPAGWAIGALMLVVILLGFSLQYFIPHAANEYQGVIRLAMLAAFPLLFLLPMRFSTLVGNSEKHYLQAKSDAGQPDHQIRSGVYDEALMMQSFMSSMLEAPPEQACLLVNKAIAGYMHADISVLALPLDEHNGQLHLQCGYDSVQDLPFSGSVLDKQQAPVIVSALRQGRAVNLPAKSTSPDLVNIAGTIGLTHCGALMFMPVISSDGKPFYGILLLSPYNNREWNAEDQSRLARIAKPMVYFLQLKQQVARLQAELAETRTTARLAMSKPDQEEYYPNMQDQVESLREQLHLALEEVAMLKETLGKNKPNGAFSPVKVPASASSNQ